MRRASAVLNSRDEPFLRDLRLRHEPEVPEPWVRRHELERVLLGYHGTGLRAVPVQQHDPSGTGRRDVLEHEEAGVLEDKVPLTPDLVHVTELPKEA